MIAKRVIPCLDVHDGQVTRGVQFGVAEKGGLRNVGDPVELALRYNEQGADEMVFFDITATAHGRGTMVEVIERAADQCFMPLTVGGGIKSVDECSPCCAPARTKFPSTPAPSPIPNSSGKARKNSAASASSSRLTPRKSRRTNGACSRTAAARKPASTPSNGRKRAVALGAGEIVLNSIDADGTKAGFDLVITRRMSEAVGVPVVASGGAGTLEHMAEVLLAGKADAVLAASIFHFGTFTVGDVKQFLAEKNIPVRL